MDYRQHQDPKTREKSLNVPVLTKIALVYLVKKDRVLQHALHSSHNPRTPLNGSGANIATHHFDKKKRLSPR